MYWNEIELLFLLPLNTLDRNGIVVRSTLPPNTSDCSRTKLKPKIAKQNKNRCVSDEKLLNEQLARSWVNCFENLVISNGAKLEEATWQRICCCVDDIFERTLPHRLLVWSPNDVAVVRPPPCPSAGFYWVLMSFTGFYRVLLGFT